MKQVPLFRVLKVLATICLSLTILPVLMGLCASFGIRGDGSFWSGQILLLTLSSTLGLLWKTLLHPHIVKSCGLGLILANFLSALLALLFALLEMLLFYSVPRKDTNEMAHQLISRFGSLAGVLEAAVLPLHLFSLWSIRNRSCFSLRKPCCRTAVRQYPHQLFFRDPYRCRLSLCLFSMVPEMGDQQCHACHLLSADRRGFCPVPKSVRN